jgi:hypothetical protein
MWHILVESAAALASPTLPLSPQSLSLKMRVEACVRQEICSRDGITPTERVTTLLPAERRMVLRASERGGVSIHSLSC